MLMLLALGNATAKCKGYLAFQAPKCIASGNAIAKYCKFFCNSATMQFYLQNCTVAQFLKKKKKKN